MTASQKIIALAAKVPADLHSALAERYRLIDVNSEAAIAALQSAEVMVTTAVRGFSAEDIRRFPALKLVLSQGVGRDRIDFATARAHGVAVSVTPDAVMTEDVADFAIALMAAAARLIVEADRFVRDGRWGAERIRSSVRVSGKRVGVVGMGRIGKAVARRAAGLGMSVGYTSRRAIPDLPYSFSANAVELAKASDFLILCCPGGEETRHLCNRDVIAALGPKGILVNVSRGSVVDEEALIDALAQGRLRSAALDVFATEPKIDTRFLSLSNVVLTPHSATITEEARVGVIGCMIEDAENHFAGRPLRYAST